MDWTVHGYNISATIFTSFVVVFAARKLDYLKSDKNPSYNILNIRMFELMLLGLFVQIAIDLFLGAIELMLDLRGNNEMEHYPAVVLTSAILISLRHIFHSLIQFF